MKKGYTFVLLTALVSGVSIFLNKFGVGGMNPYVFTWSKNLLVSLLLISSIIIFKEFKTLKELNIKQWGKLITIGLFGGSIPFLLFFKGLSMAPSPTAALLHKSMFIVVALLAAFYLKEKLSKGFFIAAALLFAGNFLLLGKTGFSFALPEAMILTAVLFWSAETIISKHALKEIPSRIVAFGRMFFGIMFMLVFLIATGNITHLTTLTIPQLGWIIFTSILLFAYVSTWYAGLKLIPAHKASSILVVGSAITTLLSFIYSGSITLTALAGVALILTGITTLLGYSYIMSRSRILAQSLKLSQHLLLHKK